MNKLKLILPVLPTSPPVTWRRCCLPTTRSSPFTPSPTSLPVRGQKLTASPVKELALAHELPVYQPASLRKEEAQAELAALGADLMVVVAYGLILPKAVLDTPRLGCINVHGSCCRAGAVPPRSSAPSGRVMPKPASPSCRWMWGWIPAP